MGIDYFNLQEKVYILDRFKKFELPRELYVKATGLSKVLPHNRFHKGWFGLFNISGDKQPFTRQEIESVLNETYVDCERRSKSVPPGGTKMYHPSYI